MSQSTMDQSPLLSEVLFVFSYATTSCKYAIEGQLGQAIALIEQRC